eukprot:6184145-Pleurochrysis_carterae.AAC.2
MTLPGAASGGLVTSRVVGWMEGVAQRAGGSDANRRVANRRIVSSRRVASRRVENKRVAMQAGREQVSADGIVARRRLSRPPRAASAAALMCKQVLAVARVVAVFEPKTFTSI